MRNFLVYVVAILLANHSAIALQPQDTCTNDAMIVMDASGSMSQLFKGGNSKIEAARLAAHEVVPISSQHRRLGLLTLGPGRKEQCSNINLAIPVQFNSSVPILDSIDKIKTDGGTPLSLAIEEAANALDYTRKQATIIVLTDGDDSCGRNPCETAQHLKEKSDDLTIHVIGLKGGFDEITSAACIAEKTGGIFAETSTFEELKNAMGMMLLCPSIS